MKRMSRMWLMGLVVLMSLCVSEAKGQMVFSLFKLKYTMVAQLKTLDIRVVIDGDKPAKYVKLEWVAVNRVGDVIETGGTLLRKAVLTGPFYPYKKSKTMYQNVYSVVPVVAIPTEISIEYMDGTTWETEITKENYKQFFPSLKWHEYTMPDEIEVKNEE